MQNTSAGLAGSILPEANLHFLDTQGGLVEDIRTKKLSPQNRC